MVAVTTLFGMLLSLTLFSASDTSLRTDARTSFADQHFPGASVDGDFRRPSNARPAVIQLEFNSAFLLHVTKGWLSRVQFSLLQQASLLSAADLHQRQTCDARPPNLSRRQWWPKLNVTGGIDVLSRESATKWIGAPTVLVVRRPKKSTSIGQRHRIVHADDDEEAAEEQREHSISPDSDHDDSSSSVPDLPLTLVDHELTSAHPAALAHERVAGAVTRCRGRWDSVSVVTPADASLRLIAVPQAVVWAGSGSACSRNGLRSRTVFRSPGCRMPLTAGPRHAELRVQGTVVALCLRESCRTRSPYHFLVEHLPALAVYLPLLWAPVADRDSHLQSDGGTAPHGASLRVLLDMPLYPGSRRPDEAFIASALLDLVEIPPDRFVVAEGGAAASVGLAVTVRRVWVCRRPCCA